MSPKPRHIAETLFELTQDASVENAKKTVASLTRWLKERGRLSMLERVLSEYKTLLVCRNAAHELTIRSTAGLSEKTKDAVREAVGAPKDAAVKEVLDPSLTGGVVAKYNDTLLDASLKARIKQLEEAFLK